MSDITIGDASSDSFVKLSDKGMHVRTPRGELRFDEDGLHVSYPDGSALALGKSGIKTMVAK